MIVDIARRQCRALRRRRFEAAGISHSHTSTRRYEGGFSTRSWLHSAGRRPKPVRDANEVSFGRIGDLIPDRLDLDLRSPAFDPAVLIAAIPVIKRQSWNTARRRGPANGLG